MSEDIGISPQQLVVLRQLCFNEKVDSSDTNVDALVQKGLAERNSSNEAVIASDGARLLSEWEIFPEKNETRHEEAIKLFGRINEQQKIVKDIEALCNRSNLSSDEKVKHIAACILHSRIEPTFQS
jgi:hypothetical protein